MKWFKWNSPAPAEDAAPDRRNLDLGERGEEWAAKHLRQRGYKILVRRFKTRSGEIDLVARDGEWLVFVEVKTRRSELFGVPGQAVDLKKQRHISKTALDYLRKLKYPRIRFRFDIVEVILDDDDEAPEAIRLYQNAFDLAEPYIY